MLHKKYLTTILLSSALITSQAFSDDSLVPNKKNIGMAFTGGGWHAHAGHSGWLAGAMDSTKQDLTHLMSNVDTLASNSGGSWFLSMLAFSDKFVNSLETVEGRNSYSTTGYLGNSYEMFQDTIKDNSSSTCPIITKISTTAGNICNALSTDFDIINKYDRSNTGENHLGWGDLVRTSVYQPVGKHALEDKKLHKVTLQDSHLSWATNKSLVFSSTALTEDVVISADDIYLKSFLLPKVQYSMSFDNKVPRQKNFTPVFFTSLDKSSHKATPFFSAGNPKLTYWRGEKQKKPTHDRTLLFHAGKHQLPVRKKDNTAKETFNIDANLSLDKVKIVNATISSSSAAGMSASKKLMSLLTGDTSSELLGEASWLLSALATPVDLNNSSVTFKNSGYVLGSNGYRGYELLESVKKKRTIRLADGGYFDNTGVSYLIRHMQENNLDDNFNVISFLNNTTPADCHDYIGKYNDCQKLVTSKMKAKDYPENITKLLIPNSGAILFGASKGAGETANFRESLKTSVPTMSAQVFSANNWLDYASKSNNKPEWGYNWPITNPKEPSLRYYKVPVTTVENKTLGVTAGSQGTLHLFIQNDFTTSAMPGSMEALNAYTTDYKVTRIQMQNKNGYAKSGAGYLKEALGLSTK